jgi:hypothetical protein
MINAPLWSLNRPDDLTQDDIITNLEITPAIASDKPYFDPDYHSAVEFLHD